MRIVALSDVRVLVFYMKFCWYLKSNTKSKNFNYLKIILTASMPAAKTTADVARTITLCDLFMHVYINVCLVAYQCF